MLLLISDTSVLIDVECSGLTVSMFDLPYQFAVPDILFDQELKERHAHLLNYGLICRMMSGDLIDHAYGLRQQYTKVSTNDLLALTLAKHENCQLLTGDKALSDVAKVFNIKVHGTIWLIEQMIKRKIIDVSNARNAFQRMKNSGSRLPWDTVEAMLVENESEKILDASV